MMGLVGIRVIVFDVYGTLFNVHSVIEKCDELFPGRGEEISSRWREKQLEYSFIRQMIGSYRPFDEMTRDSLRYTCEQLGVNLSAEKERELLLVYLSLSPYEEVAQVLEQLARNSYKLAVLSNGSPSMLYPLIEHHGYNRLLDDVISVDDVKQYKPSPQAYTYGLDRLRCRREEVLFLSSNTWDITGASTYGFRTVWVNRKHGVFDQLGVQPDAIISDFRELSGVIKV
ncbi:haloacid dehalogenase type II [Micrococcus luteus]|nr:haloacid dehalogenase type II [Micrococcus luteus]